MFPRVISGDTLLNLLFFSSTFVTIFWAGVHDEAIPTTSKAPYLAL